MVNFCAKQFPHLIDLIPRLWMLKYLRTWETAIRDCFEYITQQPPPWERECYQWNAIFVDMVCFVGL